MATKRTAQVAIRNNQSEAILAVGVKHKYSDNYENNGQWGVVQPGGLTDKKLTVEYHTGFLTTGVDWYALIDPGVGPKADRETRCRWGVSWYSKDTKTLYYSNPENFRGVIDAAERITPATLAPVTAAAGILAGAAGPGAATAAMAAATVAGMTVSTLFNSEGTAGFKRHMLVTEDENQTTEIIINEDNTITFKSPSGISETVTATKSV